jgi:hypothetical protein
MSDHQEQPPQWFPQQYPLQPAAHDEIEQQQFPQQSFWNQQPLSQNDQPTFKNLDKSDQGEYASGG